MKDVNIVIENALLAFWASVAEEVPEAKTGDLSPDLDLAFRDSARRVIQSWIERNTPVSGKWKVFECDDQDNGRYVFDADGNLVADCFADTHLGFGLPDRDDWQRNARLIAKAPVMRDFISLIACMKTEEEFGADQPEGIDWVFTMNNLIASARKIAGETSKQ